ncbi:hypothetical protein OG887_33475 [Streptomyces sp. NBC_00053]|uniref:hypothetical protein n=1 Tax=unclassified Streptomyces TaxID=2593676 RepID=UPI00225620BF|nr:MULTISPECIES: hypothetical protein [unclassified Streptomyces]WSX05086.1 hypothetical protein OG355_34125 [Streptomyces sp. NBC_00987]MCX4392699.1 hypothetical protein [Streptomyces sp. NBC_01767]MCX5104827.1 hypothetical protein [Streptomyces sp. NBC_00439]MCX5164125.1 hypothetical protein [Streptomyces sp. NBC_00305]MCX5222649.1 hypothetical protein [Streptomyces sp. NBC_00264]
MAVVGDDQVVLDPSVVTAASRDGATPRTIRVGAPEAAARSAAAVRTSRPGTGRSSAPQ